MSLQQNLLLKLLFISSSILSCFLKSLNETSPDNKEPATSINKPKGEPSNGIPSIALRTVYVVSGLCLLVIVYFIVRAVCANRYKFCSKRYRRMKVNGSEQMELHRLSELEDEDDDLTLFDAKQAR